jgi:hypothetical protein
MKTYVGVVREKALGTHQIDSWVGPRASLDVAAKRKIPAQNGTLLILPTA